jgi:hypothetical protein
MIRSKSVTTAAVLLLAMSIANALAEVPNLTRGTAQDADPNVAPFAMTLFSFVLAIAGMFAAYGLLQNARWGKILTIVLMTFRIVYSLVPLLVAPEVSYKILAAAEIALAVLIIVLVLSARPQPSAVESRA